MYTVVGDPHVTNKSLDRFKSLTEFVESQGFPVIWMGDLLDNKEVIRGKCLNAWFEYLRSSKLNHIIIVGNHDWFNLECQDHSLKSLSALSNVTIVDRPMELNGIWFLPYEHKLDKLRSQISHLPEGSVLFSHMDVKSFDYGNGYLAESGLDLEDLKKFKLVVSGHYHAYQQRDNLVYIGTPFSHSFGETDQVKYIGFFDESKSTLSIVPTTMPRHLTLEIDLDEPPEMGELHEYFDKHYDDYVRVLLYGTQGQIAGFNKSTGLVDSSRIRWIPKPTETSTDGISLDEGIDNKTQFTKWAQDIRKLDNETTKLGLEILEALNAK